MKMMTVYLSDADEKRLARIRKLRYGDGPITEEQLIKKAIATYWFFAEERAQKEKPLQEEKADRRLREESMGVTDSWRDYDDND